MTEGVEIKLRAQEPEEFAANTATRIEMALDAHLEQVSSFFEAGSAYDDQRQEIQGEIGRIEQKARGCLESAVNSSSLDAQEGAHTFLSVARENLRHLIVATELLTVGDKYALAGVNWETMDWQIRSTGREAHRKPKALRVGTHKFTRSELATNSEDPVLQTRFYLAVLAHKNR